MVVHITDMSSRHQYLAQLSPALCKFSAAKAVSAAPLLLPLTVSCIPPITLALCHILNIIKKASYMNMQIAFIQITVCV